MRGIQKQAFRTIVLVMILALGLGLAGWYGLHRTEATITDFEALNLPEMSTALNLSEGVAQLAALAPYVAGSAKPFQLQAERQRLETRFSDLKTVAASLKNTVFKQDLEARLTVFRKSLAELIEHIETELFLREDLLAAQFALAEMKRGGRLTSATQADLSFDVVSALGFLVDPSSQPTEFQRQLAGDLLARLSVEGQDPVLYQRIDTLLAKIFATRSQERAIDERKTYLLASLRAQSEQLAEQVNRFTADLQAEVVKQRQRVQATVFNAYVLMLVLAILLALGMLHHYRFNSRMTRDLAVVTEDMLRLAEAGDTNTRHIGVQREDEIGEIARAYTVFRDYALKIKEYSGRLARQKVLLETVFNQINDGLSVFSSAGKLVSWNKRFLQIFNLTEAEVYAGRDLGELQALMQRDPHEHRTLANDPVDLETMNLLRRDQPQTFERRYDTGKVVEFRSQPMPDGGFVTLYGDLTRRKAVEAQLHQAQKMELLGQLTGGVAHDFNNLLAAVLTNLQLLSATEGLSPKQQRYTLRSISVTEKGVTLIQRLLAFSRKQRLFPEAVRANDLITGMLDLIEYSMAPGIAISSDLQATAAVFVDPSQLENAILNLALNSSAAMPDGGRLRFVTRPCTLPESQQEGVSISVEDSGVGIPRQMRQRVLEPFFTTKPAGQGSGMGLSMVYGFVKQSGGELQIESGHNWGTRITLRLPLAEAGAVGQARKTDPFVEAVVIPAGKKILLVEDNPEVRQAICEQIESFGYATAVAADARVALELLSEDEGAYGLVLTDISLGGVMSGVALKHQLGKQRPDLAVILTSGLPRENLEQHYGLAPETEFLAKPISPTTLKRLLGIA